MVCNNFNILQPYFIFEHYSKQTILFILFDHNFEDIDIQSRHQNSQIIPQIIFSIPINHHSSNFIILTNFSISVSVKGFIRIYHKVKKLIYEIIHAYYYQLKLQQNMRHQQNRLSFQEEHKSTANFYHKPRSTLPTQQQDSESTPKNNHKFKRKKSNSSIQSIKIERRSGSAKFKKFKQSKLEISQVYIKKPLIENFNSESVNETNNQTPTKSSKSLLQNETQQQQRNNQKIHHNLSNRRPLTPHKTQQQVQMKYSQIKKEKKQNQIRHEILLDEKEIEVAVLMDKLKNFEIENQNLRKIVMDTEKQCKKLKNQRNQFQKKNQELQQQNSVKSVKLSTLETSLLQNQTNLAQTKNNLEKLKRVIKENRINELQRENKKFQQKIQEFSKENQQIKQQNLKLVNQIQKLKQQIGTTNLKINKLQQNYISKQKSYQIESMKEQYLNREIIQLRNKLNHSGNEKEKNLQEIIQNLRLQLSQADNKIKKQQIKIHCLCRKQQSCLEQLKKQKQKQYDHLKQRFRKFLVQYQKFRKQHNQLKIQNSKLRREKMNPKLEDQQFSYQLSPQKVDRS